MKYQNRTTLRVQALFDRIAPSYDLVNDLLSLGIHRFWKRELVNIAWSVSGARPNSLILDVATGTGDLALLHHERGGRVYALDLSSRMLELAQKRESRTSLQSKIKRVHVHWLHGDLLQTDALGKGASIERHLSKKFDICTIAFGLRNMVDPTQALDRMWLKLSEDGVLGVLEFGDWSDGVFARFVASLGRMMSRDQEAYAYLVESSRAFKLDSTIMDWASTRGLDVQRRRWLFGKVGRYLISAPRETLKRDVNDGNALP
jgi:demethylmenaquinone methyltransferase/2-methoxy-6-polyprenyl-1,4-benzoquinol methylase